MLGGKYSKKERGNSESAGKDFLPVTNPQAASLIIEGCNQPSVKWVARWVI